MKEKQEISSQWERQRSGDDREAAGDVVFVPVGDEMAVRAGRSKVNAGRKKAYAYPRYSGRHSSSVRHAGER